MADPRNEVLDWSEQGRIPPGKLRAALEAAGALPSAAQWRRFLDRLLLWMGSVMLASSAIFFFAFNWDEMGRLAKIGLVEALLDRKTTRLNSSHIQKSRMPSSA